MTVTVKVYGNGGLNRVREYEELTFNPDQAAYLALSFGARRNPIEPPEELMSRTVRAARVSDYFTGRGTCTFAIR